MTFGGLDAPEGVLSERVNGVALQEHLGPRLYVQGVGGQHRHVVTWARAFFFE